MNTTKRNTLAKISVALSLFSAVGVAQAASLSILGSTSTMFNSYSGQPAASTGIYTSGFLGTLAANQNSIITFTYLGAESGFNNSFSFLGQTLNESNTVGTVTAPVTVGAGALNFTFSDNQGGSFTNGGDVTPTLGFAILDGNLAPTNGTNFGPFDYVLGFNDSASGEEDYDDFVVGVSVVAAPISAVPLPASLPLMALSLGLFTAAAARRKV